MATEERVAVAVTPTEHANQDASSSANSWTAGNQSFALHKVYIQAHDPGSPSIECAMLLDSTIIPLLPKKPLALPPPLQPTFKISSAGDKGVGMFAVRDIPAGALILIEHPIIITPAIVPLPSNSRAYECLFDQLQPLARQELLTMTNCRRLDECSIEEGIARTNGTGIDILTPLAMVNNAQAKEYGAVFLKINRSNHSCGPNAAQKWDLASFSLSLYALRPILTGEEITMIYTDVTASRETRRTKLRSMYGFDCTCTYCDLIDDDAIARSDLARAELRDWKYINPGFLNWSTDMCRSDDTIIKSHQRALELIDQEGMHGLQCTYLDGIALSYAMLGDVEQFRVWGQRLVDVCVVQDPEHAAEYVRWLANPQSLKKWGWRTKQRLQASRGRRRRGDSSVLLRSP